MDFLRVERDGRSWDTFTGGRLHDKFERRNGVEDRAPQDGVRLESRHARERRLVPGLHRYPQGRRATRPQRHVRPYIREILTCRSGFSPTLCQRSNSLSSWRAAMFSVANVRAPST